MRYRHACKKKSYAANDEGSWPLGVSHNEQHTKFARECARLGAVAANDDRSAKTPRFF